MLISEDADITTAREREAKHGASPFAGIPQEGHTVVERGGAVDRGQWVGPKPLYLRSEKNATAAVDAVLAERATQHGEFVIQAGLTQAFKDAAHGCSRFASMPAIHREAVDMILHKVARVLAGDPNHLDHWLDIAGYAKLVLDRIAPK